VTHSTIETTRKLSNTKLIRRVLELDGFEWCKRASLVVVKRNFLEAKPLLKLSNGKNILRKLTGVETLLRGRLARRRLLAKLRSANEPVAIGGKSSKQTWR